MPKGIELKTEVKRFQFELKEHSETGEIAGYGAVYNNVDRGGDVIDARAFDLACSKAVATGSMPKMLFQHDPSRVIGLWTEMMSDDYGLHMKGRLLTELPLGNEVHVLLKNNAIDGLSIGYRTLDYTMERGGKVRRLKELALIETSVVTVPMNELATVTTVKSLQTASDFERILLQAGVPQNFAQLITEHGFDEAKRLATLEPGAETTSKKASQLVAALTNLKEAFNA